MIIIPKHIYEMLDQIIKECDEAYENGIKVASSISDKVRDFKKYLNEESVNFCEDDEYVIQKNIMNQICKWFKFIGYKKPGREVICQKQLKIELIKAIMNNEDISNDSVIILDFIGKSKQNSWSKIDEHIKRKIFKLVKTNGKLEEILQKTSDSNDFVTSEEISIGKCKRIRIAFVEESFSKMLKKEHCVNEYKRFCKEHCLDNESTDVFRFWHNMPETGIYYVYVPEE